MKNIQNNEFKSVVGGGGNPAVEGAATAAGIAFAAATALAASTLSGLAAVGLGAVAIAASPNINGTPGPSMNNVTPTNVDPLGNVNGGRDDILSAPSSSYSGSSISDSGGGGGGGGKVICTELCRNGVIEHDVWMADIRYSRDNFSAQTMRGYHLWGIPYVKLMRQYPAFAKLAAYPTRWFAADIAYRMGVRSKPNYAGWAVRELAFRPICWSLGIVAKARDWQSLWATPQAIVSVRSNAHGFSLGSIHINPYCGSCPSLLHLFKST